MTDTVESVNKEPAPVADSESKDSRWVDPMFIEKAETRLADEPEPTADEIAAAEAEKAAAAEAERIERGDLNADELKAVLDDNPDDDDPDGKPVGGDPGSEAGAGKAAEEAAAAEKAKAGEGDDPDADPDDDDDEEQDGKPQDGETGKRPRRRSRARRERRAMERKIADMEREIAALKGTAKPEAAKPDSEQENADEIGARPKLEDFDHDVDQWSEALADWTEKRLTFAQTQEKKAEEAEQAAAAEEARKKVVETFKEREEDARDRYDDYDDVVYDPTVFIPDAVADLIVESENGPELAYYLATHQDEAMKLKDLSERQVAREIGRLETRLAAEAPSGDPDTENTEGAEEAKAAAEAKPKPTSQPQPRRTPTKAPDPVPTLRGGAAPSRDPKNMDMDEYAEARRSGKLR